MGSSFNYFARKVRNVNLPHAVRASALNSCVREFSACIPERPYHATLDHLRQVVGSDLRHSSEESHLLAALQQMERVRNQVLELKRAFQCKRIRQKCRGSRVPSKAEQKVLLEAITNVRRAAGMLPMQEPERLVCDQSEI